MEKNNRDFETQMEIFVLVWTNSTEACSLCGIEFVETSTKTLCKKKKPLNRLVFRESERKESTTFSRVNRKVSSQ